jgi:hypothetical protein
MLEVQMFRGLYQVVWGGLLCLLLVACGGHPMERPVPDLAGIHAKLAFTCAQEKDHLPSLDPNADKFYRYARWLRKNQIEKEDPLRYPEMERYFRVATAYGHYKANLDLRIMIGQGQAYSDDPVKETLDLTQELIDHKVPGGYYDMARYIKAGYGVKQDEELALKYYRKAADMGSPEAQYLLYDRLTDLDDSVAKNTGYQMLHCAADQGHAKAALEYATYMKGKDNKEAIKYYQLATKFGDESGPSYLRDAFMAPTRDDRINYLGLAKDEERSRRYKAIWSILSDYSYAQPKVPELDDIVPLPPAKLPPWDGKLKWLEEFNANVPPEKPDEALIVRMAKAKGLDPKTGRPLQTASQTSQAEPAPVPTQAESQPNVPSLGTQCRSGETCPQSGQWQAIWPEGALGYVAVRHIEAGQTFPDEEVRYPRTGLSKLLGKPEARIEPVGWKLIRHG